MSIFKQLFRFYINSSIHVGLSCCALLQLSQQQLLLKPSITLALFVFLGTVFAYNFVKFESFVRLQKKQIPTVLRVIIIFSGIVFLALIYFYFQLPFLTQVVAAFLLVITILYTLPFFPNTKNARNWAGLKIYIVSFCWATATVFLPILENNHSIDFFVLIYGCQRFVLVFVLILIFEIVDLKKDDPLLQTVPQQIGIAQTKKTGYFLLIIFCLLEFLTHSFQLMSFIFGIIIAFFLAFANENRSKYYTVFWVESVPIVWWLCLTVFQ